MRELSDSREFRVRLRDVIRQPDEQIEPQLSELNMNSRGSRRAQTERLVRAISRMVGEVEREMAPEEEELVMGQTDHEVAIGTEEDQTVIQSEALVLTNKGLRSVPELAAAIAEMRKRQIALSDLATANLAEQTHQVPPAPTNDGEISRIGPGGTKYTVEPAGGSRAFEPTSNQFLLPPVTDTRDLVRTIEW